jgi:membrane associated rhomboid family serine protease
MTFPDRRILLLLFPYPIRAKYLVLIVGGLEVFLMVFFSRDGIAHLAHLGGLLTGYLYLKNIPMRWFRGGGRRGGGPRIYDIRNYRDPSDRDSSWK